MDWFSQAKLDAMEKSVANPDLGSDLRGVKKLLKDHQVRTAYDLIP